MLGTLTTATVAKVPRVAAGGGRAWMLGTLTTATVAKVPRVAAGGGRAGPAPSAWACHTPRPRKGA